MECFNYLERTFFFHHADFPGLQATVSVANTCYNSVSSLLEHATVHVSIVQLCICIAYLVRDVKEYYTGAVEYERVTMHDGIISPKTYMCVLSTFIGTSTMFIE